MTTHFRFHAFSQRGKGKLHNEDALLLNHRVYQGSVRESGLLAGDAPQWFAIADGVSSSFQPRRASRTLLQMLETRLTCDRDASLKNTLWALNRDFTVLGESAALQGMASTLVGARMDGLEVTVFNVGDSVACVLGANGRWAQLSRDHTVLQDMLDDGEINADQVKLVSRIYSGLTSQFISEPDFDDFRVHFSRHTLQPGDLLVLASDGLTETLSTTEMETIFSARNDLDLQKVMHASRALGGGDDFSVITLSLEAS